MIAEIYTTDTIPYEVVVEAVVSDGGIERTGFSGPDAIKRAEDYASRRYGNFEMKKP